MTMTDHDHDHEDSADTGDDTPESEAALEHETAQLRLMLSLCCNGHRTRAVMAALSVTLQAVVVEVARDLPEIDAYVGLFQRSLREWWLADQQTDETEH